MTTEHFVGYIESYYGRYQRPAQRQTVAAYLARYDEHQLSVLSRRLILEYSGQFRFTPDVAILEGIARKLDGEDNGWGVGRVARIQGPPEPDDGGVAASAFSELINRVTGSKLEWRKKKWASRKG